MRNIPVWGKVALGLAVSALITLVVAAVGSLGISHTGDALSETVARHMPAQAHLAALRTALTAIQRAERTLLIPETMENPALLEQQRTGLAKSWADAGQAMAAFEALPPAAIAAPPQWTTPPLRPTRSGPNSRTPGKNGADATARCWRCWRTTCASGPWPCPCARPAPPWSAWRRPERPGAA